MVRQTWGVAKDRMSRLRWLWYSVSFLLSLFSVLAPRYLSADDLNDVAATDRYLSGLYVTKRVFCVTLGEAILVRE